MALFVIATDVPGAMADFGTPRARRLDRLTAAEAERMLGAGQFPAGSMGPKVRATVRFVRATGRRAVICAIDAIEAAVAGRAGTAIVP